jgi:Arylsulfotransferase (ASST)
MGLPITAVMGMLVRRQLPEKGIMVRLGLAAKVAVGGVVALALALAAYARFGAAEPPGPRALKTVAPGVYNSPTPGIVAVNGECTGELALTPAASHYQSATTVPYPLVYDCTAKTFTVLKSLPNPTFAGDLTLTNDGYYVQLSRFSERDEIGSYFFYDRDGKEIHEVAQPADPKVHDLIVGDHDVTIIQYAHDWDSAGCGVPAALDIEIINKDFDGKVLWKWSSKGHFDTAQRVSTHASMHEPDERRVRRAFYWLRNCYTSIARRLVKFDVPKWLLFSNGGTVFALEDNDYVHVNSIQRLEPSGDILVSARHLDTVFIIDRKTGDLKWSLGGKFSRVSQSRPAGDPRGGFSHQHYVRIVGNRLYVFDNGNLFPDLPSRAVVYQLDSQPPNKMVFQFPEPNGKQRYSLGSVQLLQNNQLLIGWGAVNEVDMGATQRAVSIVNMDDGKEVFSIDMAPSWLSYRVKAVQP